MASKESSKVRHRNWVFTLNNPDKYVTYDATQEDGNEHGTVDYELSAWRDCIAKASYVLCQIERGESGTVHLQGYLELQQPLGLSGLKKLLPTAHWEPRYGSQEDAINYVSKSDTKLAGPFSYGVKKQQGERVDFAKALAELKEGKSVMEVIEDTPSMLRYVTHLDKISSKLKLRERPAPKIIWLFGQTGSGKTKSAWDIFGPEAYVFLDPDKGTAWFDGYGGEANFIWDEFSGNYPFRKLLVLLDRYPLREQIKGSFVNIRACNFIITSNQNPSDFYLGGLDREPLSRRLKEFGLVGEFIRRGGVRDRGSNNGDSGGERFRVRYGNYGEEQEATVSIKEFVQVAKDFFKR